MHQISEVPGGQDLFVNVNGLVAITVQHSHSIPPGAYWEYQGWTWTALPVTPTSAGKAAFRDCPRTNSAYNCDIPAGYWSFQAPNSTRSGVIACQDGSDTRPATLYAVTPEFSRLDCVPLKGLGTHPYSGPNPPVWAYY